MNLPRHRRSQGGKSPLPIEMSPMIKIVTTKRYAFLVSVSFSIFAYNSKRVQQTNINIDDQVTWTPSNQTFDIQFKSITRTKLRVFVPKVAASGPHLIML